MKLRLFPQKLASQFVVLLLLALIVSQLISGIILYRQHKDVVGAINRRDIGERIFTAMRLIQQSDAGQHEKVLRAVSSDEVSIWLSDKPEIEPVPEADQDLLFSRYLHRVLAPWGVTDIVVLIKPIANAKDKPPQQFRLQEEELVVHPGRGSRHSIRKFKHRKLQAGWMSAVMQLSDGRWLNLQADVNRRPPLLPLANWVSMLFLAVLLLAVVLFMVRRITRPLRDLQLAAEKLGRGEMVEPVPEIGPVDIRQTSHAFNLMTERLQRFVKDRTTMLAALSHDLRTPITTLRLRAELMDDEKLQAAFLSTLDEMQAMAEATLAFVREEASGEPTQKVDLAALTDSLCQDLASIGKQVEFQDCDALFYDCRPVAIKRCITNLVENAVKYAGAASVMVEQSDQQVVIQVVDDGPGIPEDKIESLFKPFVRLEESRNQATGGVGLGLAITRSIARNHGGDVSLENRPEGGLCARLWLPAG